MIRSKLIEWLQSSHLNINNVVRFIFPITWTLRETAFILQRQVLLQASQLSTHSVTHTLPVRAHVPRCTLVWCTRLTKTNTMWGCTPRMMYGIWRLVCIVTVGGCRSLTIRRGFLSERLFLGFFAMLVSTTLAKCYSCATLVLTSRTETSRMHAIYLLTTFLTFLTNFKKH